MFLEIFPNELLLMIAVDLDQRSLSALSQTNHFFTILLKPKLHEFATQPKDNLPPLCWAALRGHVPLVRLLLDKGLNPDCWPPKRPRKGPLHYATINRHETIVQLLLEKGAKIDAKYSNSLTALWDAVKANNESMVKLLLDNGANVNPRSKKNRPLHLAAQLGYLPIARLLVEQGARIDVESSRGTALVHAAAFNHKATVEFFASKGACVDALDVYYHKTSLAMAAEAGQVDIARILLAYGADCEMKDFRGRTALHLALSNWIPQSQNSREIVELLLAHGASPNVRDEQGRTPLHVAATQGACDNMEETVTLLVDHKAEINAVDNKGDTALHIAVQTRNSRFFGWLVLKGADIHIENDSGTSPHELATELGCTEMLAHLWEVGPILGPMDDY